jgi:5-oxoprolinase (ATP-hydrolysing) subunit A
VTAPRVVDLNADLGEEVTDDAGLLAVVTSANVACGYHAGTPAIMREVCARAAELGVAVGAQVSYDDRPGFGRRPLDVAPDVLREQVADQVGQLDDAARAGGTTVRYLKPHGALYHRTIDDEEQAAAVLAGSGSLPVLGMPGALLRLADEAGRRVVLEGFPDRGYGDDGRLLPRDRPGAVLDDADAIGAHALDLAGSVASLCLHGDTPGAVGHARAVRAALAGAGWRLAPFV